MTSDRLKRYMRRALDAATDSKDSTKVGAVLVSDEGATLLTAYNGIPMGVEDRPERREVRPDKYRWASHAEQNLVAFAARYGIATRGLTVVVTHHPCPACARSLIQAGIKRVVYGPGSAVMPLDEEGACTAMFSEAGLEVIPYVEQG